MDPSGTPIWSRDVQSQESRPEERYGETEGREYRQLLEALLPPEEPHRTLLEHEVLEEPAPGDVPQSPCDQ